MKSSKLDLVVIGGGSGGVRAARMAAMYGKKVALIESKDLGGTCVNLGCIPKKLFSYAAHCKENFEESVGFGWKHENLNFSWTELIQNKNKEIARLNEIYQKLLENSGVSIIREKASFVNRNTIKAGSINLTSENILIATGGTPVKPNFLSDERIITSDEAFHLKKLPSTISLVGGGYIALEFASIFNGLGCTTNLLYRGPLFLRGFDSECREFLANQMKDKGINLIFNCDVKNIESRTNELELTTSDSKKIESELIMFATGRRPNIDGLGLEELDLKLDSENAVVVDTNYKTSIDNIFAIGDITNRINLTPVAINEAMALTDFLYGDKNKTVNYENVPSAIFTLPNFATVGVSEDLANEMGLTIKVYTANFKQLKHTLTSSGERCFMKLIVNSEDNKIIGAHMVGADAGEQIQGIAIAIQSGATKEDFDQTIGIHPTSAEEWVTMREERSC
ncbi:MAG: glutathione-disulfide reductase [Methylococcaceae bacterium TMED69]|nr:MAG: glutathione-disulfide reductase [Methylococcaceae bacterium TMED69]